MSFASHIPLFGFVINVFFALFMLSRGLRSRASLVYFFLCLCIANWNLGSFFLFVVKDEGSALFWARTLHFGLTFGIALFFHLSLIIAQVRIGRWIWWIYGFQTLLAASDLTPLFIKGVRDLGSSGWYSVAGPAYYAFSASFALAFVSIYILVKRLRTLPPLHRKRLHTMIFAQSMLAILGNNDILPIIGIDHYPFTNIAVYPYGSLAAIFYGLIVGYSVLQHQLLDVQVALSHLVAHFVRFAFLFCIGFGLLLGATIVLPNQFTPASFLASLGVMLASSMIASFFFPRLFGGGTERLERRLLGDRFEYHDRITSFIDSMHWYSDMNLLLADLESLLLNTVGVRSYWIILVEESTRAFSLLRSHPARAPEDMPQLQADSGLIRMFRETKADYFGANAPAPDGVNLTAESESRKFLADFEAEFCLPFMFEDEPFGMLLLGPKRNDDPFTATDIGLLVSLTKNLGVIINQIRLKNQILQTEEMELLGRMSRGMAHDLNNLLTPIWTLLQLTKEGVPAAELNTELLPVALRNTKAVRAYIREALFFSENLRPDFQPCRLDQLLQQCAELLKSRAGKHGVNIALDAPACASADLDEVLVQRMLSNIISNAIDASPAGSTIRVELVQLMKTETWRDWLRVRIADKGTGIPAQDLPRVFTPYFTTKTHGDEGRGFGLGLAICRKIVNLHCGNLTINSEVGRGTTVQMDLPTHQVKHATPHIAAVA